VKQSSQMDPVARPPVDPQLGPVLALRALVQEYPERPETLWTVNDGTLEGSVLALQGRASLAWYAAVLGVEPVPAHTFTYSGIELQVMRLSATWRDVPVVVNVSVPVLVPTKIRTSDGTTVTAVAA
jgi:hypothetical protein